MNAYHGPGVQVLEDPLTNKGTAFSEQERSEFGLRGLLPAVVETLEQQVRRRYQAYQEQRAHRTVDRVRSLHRRGRAPRRRACEAADHHAAVQSDQPQRSPATSLADWTEGRALVATGSPFAPMKVGDASIPVAQCDNIYIFPGIGLAVTAVRATRITDAMMTAAAAAVGDAATIRHDPHGTLLPDRARLADMATVVAGAVARAAVADAVAPALTDDQIDQAIHRTRWLPRYRSAALRSSSALVVLVCCAAAPL